MSTVGQAKVVFEAETGQVSDQLVAAMEKALAKIDQILARMSQATETEGKKAGDGLAEGLEDGAQRAEKAVDGIDGAGLSKVQEAAAKAGAAVADEMTGGAAKADAAMDKIDGVGLSKVEDAAARAGAAVASDIIDGAGRASSALDAIDSASLDDVGAAAQAAGARIGADVTAGAQRADAALDAIDGAGLNDAAAAAAAAASSIESKVPAAAERASAAIDDVGASSDNAFDKGVVGAGLMEGALGKLAIAAGAMIGPMTVLKKGWDRLIAQDDAKHKLIALGHTTEDVSSIMDNAMASVTGTAFGFGDAASQAATLVAAGVKPGQDLERVLRLVADSASIAGTDLSDMGMIFGKAAARGRISGEEMAMLLDRQIGLLPELAKHYGVTTEEAEKMVSEGKVSFEDFTQVMEGMVGGGAEVMGQTVTGALQNVGAAAGRLGEALLSPIFQAAPAFLGGVQKALGWTTNIVKAFMGWLNSGTLAADALKVALIAIGTAGTVGAIVGVVSQIGLMAKVAGLATKAMGVLNLAFLTSPVGLLIIGITALVAAIVLLWKRSEGFRDFWIGLWNRVAEPVRETVEAVTVAWDGLMSLLRGDDSAFGHAALARVIGVDAATTVVNAIQSVRAAWDDVVAAFQGDDVGDGAFARLGETARLVWDAISRVGQVLADVGQSIASAGWETIKAVFGALVEVGKALWSAIADIAGAVWDLVQALAPVLMPILKVVGAIIGGVIVAAFFILMGALRLVAGLFEVLAKVISWLAENVLSPLIGIIGEVVGWLVEKLGGAISGVVDFIRGLFETIGAVFSWIWEQLQAAWENVGRPVVDFIIAAFQWWWEGIQLGFRLLGATFEVIWTGLQMAWDAWGRPVLDVILAAFQWAWGNLQVVFGWIKAGWDLLWAGIRWVYDTVIAPVVAWISAKFDEMRARIDLALRLVRNVIQLAANKVAEFYATYVQPMVDRVIRGFDRVRDTVTGWKDKIVGALSGAGRWLWDTGRNIVQGLLDGIGSLAGRIGSFFLDRIPGWIKGPFKKALGIASPSKLFAEYGRNIGQGLVAGVGSMEGAVQASTQGLADSAANINLPAAPAVAAAPVVTAGAAPAIAADASTGITEAYSGMAASMGATSTGLLDPMWMGQSAQMMNLGTTMTTQAQGVIAPSWDAMAAQMATTKAGVIDPTMAGVQGAVTQTAATFIGQISAVIAPALQYLVTTLFWTLNSGVNPVFSGIRGGLQHVVTTFTWAVSAIAQQWAQVREATARPVRFTIQSVFNDGLVGMWNSVSDLLGTKKMGAYPIRFASGGILPGYTPGRDPYTFVEPNTGMSIGLSGGEAIMRPEVARAMGSSWVDGVNAAARMGGPRAVQRYLGGYAGGGVVESISALVRRFWPMMSITSTYRNTPDHHGGGRAVDFSNGYDSTPAMRSATAWFAKNYQPALLELIHSPSPFNIKNGRNVGNGFGFYGAATMNQHRNHVHVAASRPLPMPGGALASVSGDVGGGDMDIAGSFTQEWKDKIATALKGYKKGAGIVDTLPEAVADKLTKAADEKIEKAFMDFSGDPGGGGVERWAPLVSSLLKLYGHPASWLRNTLRRMNQESGGNPRAINLWDSNAAKGIPSKGLMQVIDPTFQAHRDPRFPNDIWDPRANIAASMRYTMRTYGSLPNGYDRAGGYAHGGLMGEGQGWFHKTAFGPERVLSPRQTESFERLVDWIDRQPSLPIQPVPARGTAEDYGRATKTVLVTQNIIADDPRGAADAVEDRLMGLLT